MDKKIILSGIQSTGKLTLGNYIGSINNWTKIQEDYESYYMIANLHTLTIRNSPEVLKTNTLELLATYIAAGLDPEKNNIFIQSSVSAHAELAWILSCYTYIGELNRMTQYKEKSLKNQDNINSGLYMYPVLMASDILLYQANFVPVGEDQRQHIELAREIANRFNNIYGKTFVVPEGYILDSGAKVMGLQTPEFKMSKSNENINDTIFLNDTDEEILTKFKKSVTDSEGIVKYDLENKPGISNLITIYEAMTEKSIDEIEKEFNNKGYGDFKTAVAESVIEKLKPIKINLSKIIKDKDYLEKIYTKGKINAEKKANETLNKVYDKIGLIR